ncbi:hypothetical protein HBN50_16720 [Halobacteriovorax sp. GB3]|uniref:hypothetical protein n=1 Tax=Halobacteriovorax sp. GB3 TaxID=2719615 RepID=UPI0023608F2F|nr:hypothetical protein [Halobacteriovorax sp. GB3]MDD0854755.1 hypothetical protein [Halobacteriovorax sp. GB3]
MSDSSKKIPIHKDQSGQVFLEFILLVLVMISLSYVLLAGVNTNIGKRWTILVKIIAKPSTSTIELH